MRPILILVIGMAFLWYLIEYQGERAALFGIGTLVITMVAGMDTQISNIYRILDSHAKKLFPSPYDDD